MESHGSASTALSAIAATVTTLTHHSLGAWFALSPVCIPPARNAFRYRWLHSFCLSGSVLNRSRHATCSCQRAARASWRLTCGRKSVQEVQSRSATASRRFRVHGRNPWRGPRSIVSFLPGSFSLLQELVHGITHFLPSTIIPPPAVGGDGACFLIPPAPL